MKDDTLVGNFVVRANSRGSGIVVVELPCRERAVCANASGNVNHASGTKIGPGEFLFTRPYHLDRALGGARQPCRLDCRLAGMLAAVGRAGIRHQHAHPIFRNPKSLGQFAAYSERALGSSPDRQVIAVPPGQRRARLKRHVRDVRSGVGLAQMQCAKRPRPSSTLPVLKAIAVAGRIRSLLGILFEIVEKLFA